VEYLYSYIKYKFKIKLYSDKSGFDKKIYDQNLYRPGLALAAVLSIWFTLFQSAGIWQYRDEVSGSSFRNMKSAFPLSVFSASLFHVLLLPIKIQPFPLLLELADKHKIPLLGSEFNTYKINFYLVGIS